MQHIYVRDCTYIPINMYIYIYLHIYIYTYIRIVIAESGEELISVSCWNAYFIISTWNYVFIHIHTGSCPVWIHRTHTTAVLMKARFPFPCILNEIWFWWHFFFIFWNKWKYIWFKKKIHLVQNQEENCYHDHIPFNLKVLCRNP